MRAVNILLIILISILLLCFSSAYQTFSILRSNPDDTQATAIVGIDKSEVVEPYTIIKLYQMI